MINAAHVYTPIHHSHTQERRGWEGKQRGGRGR